MKRFFHHDLNLIDVQLKAISAVWLKYQIKSYDLYDSTPLLMDDTIKMYQQLSKGNRETQMNTHKAELLTAKRGIDPITLAKVTIHKNELVANTIFKILQNMTALVQEDEQDIRNKLTNAGETINQIILTSLQQGLFNRSDIDKLSSSDQVQLLWIKIGQNENIALGQAQLLLNVSKYDAVVLFEEALHSLKS